MEIKSLYGIGFGQIFAAFSRAFAEYEMQLTDAQLLSMLIRRGFDPELSFAAFEGDEIVSFTFNGIGNNTAYDTGTGTLKEYRGQGLATKIFEHSIPFLQQAGIHQYLLEVLQHNTAAVSVYRNLGFEVNREFNYFGQANDSIKTVETSHKVKPIELADCLKCTDFWDFSPSWQNSFESIERAAADFLYLGVFIDNNLVGYGVSEPVSGDVTQIAVAPKHRRKGVASALLAEMVWLNKYNAIKVINTEINCSSITDFLAASNFILRGKQFEMIKQL